MLSFSVVHKESREAEKEKKKTPPDSLPYSHVRKTDAQIPTLSFFHARHSLELPACRNLLALCFIYTGST